MIDVRIWAATPYGNRTALLDLQGQIEVFHRDLAQTVAGSYPLINLGTPMESPKIFMEALQAQCSSAARALGLPPPPDLQTYKLEEPGDFASWILQVATFHRGLQLAGGLL